jgi:hypothetical protein
MRDEPGDVLIVIEDDMHQKKASRQKEGFPPKKTADS